MEKEAIKILLQIIKEELGLNNNQLWIYNQDFQMPKTSGLFIVVNFISAKILSNNNYFEKNEEGGITEIQTCLMKESVSINIMSKNREAITRKEEVLMALQSIYSQQMQELYEFKIAKIPSNFINISTVEGSSMYNRFQIVVALNTWHKKIKESSDEYFNKFGIEVYDEPSLEEGVPLIEFNLEST